MQSETATLRGDLRRLADNLRWTFRPSVAALFARLDGDRWEALGHDARALLACLDDESLRAADVDSEVSAAVADLDAYLADPNTWSSQNAPALTHEHPVLYLSMEFGLHESLPIYSGGLGVLAGDHLKSASDLGVPLVGVGFLYREGYFTQLLDENGWQREEHPTLDPDAMPVTAVLGSDGEPLEVQVEFRSGNLHARVWEARVGRIRLLLLDTDVASNSDDDKKLTSRLYGGDKRTRVRQEVLLGVGGVRVAAALGIEPGVLHLNEGHCAFAILEAARRRVDDGAAFDDALETVARRTVFTTHTPVPAGHDRFEPALVEEHLGPMRDALGLTEAGLLGLGRVDPAANDETFCMTVLALKGSRRANGVSKLHGEVSREMWQGLYPGGATGEVPIGHITNGVHLPTWLSPTLYPIYDAGCSDGWFDAGDRRFADPEAIDEQALWSARRAAKAQLVETMRRLAPAQAERRGESAEIVEALRGALDEDALLIGFARRFATYKRAALVLSDLDTLDALINDAERPIRMVFAGKAHPRDEGGKALLQAVHRASRDPRFLGKIILLEGYDMGVARHLVAGVDVWLNNPRRPMEASGTSGEKVAMNGGLNLSILDGWWAEGYNGNNGFKIGDEQVDDDPAVQDARDAKGLLEAMRTEVASLYYDRDGDLPRGWLAKVRDCLATLSHVYDSDRMVADYVRDYYLGAAKDGSA